jgi:ribosomal protein S18 acetylase RimI-like enzyme
MPPLLLRPASPSDANRIRDFNLALALETEALNLDPDRVLQGVGALLADPSKGRYFVAESDGIVVGQMMHTYEWSDWRNGMFWWLQSVYVRPESRGRGVFTALFRHLEALAQADAGVCGLRLYVEHHNAIAQGVYRRLGLNPAGYEVFTSVA